MIGEYIDRAQSGTSDNRQSFQKMIQDSEKKTFQFVLVYQLDRFARNRYDSAIHKAKLKKNGVRVLSAKENITDDASGILIEGVLESMAEYYSVELAQKINRGMQLNAEKCLSNGSNPGLGYKVGKDRKFYIDEDEATIVREIFNRYAAGEVTADIIRDLNNRRIQTSRGKEFNKNSISRILHNKRYIGYYLYKGTETPGGMPRIIDDDLFFRVQHLIEKNKAAPGRIRGKDEYLLTTKLYCGECNTPMTGYGGTSKSGKHYHYYMCNNAKKHKCDKKAVSKEPLEDAVVDVCMSLLTEERIKFIADELYKACQDDSNLVSIKRLEAALKEAENAIENLWAALEHGQSVERITKRIDAREEEKKEIEKQLAIEKRKNRSFSYPQIFAYLDYMRTIGKKNPAQRSILVNTFIHSVYLYDDHFTIIFNGGKGQITPENIPFKNIEKSLKSEKVGTNLCSAVVTSVPPNSKNHPSGWFYYLVQYLQKGIEQIKCDADEHRWMYSSEYII